MFEEFHVMLEAAGPDGIIRSQEEFFLGHPGFEVALKRYFLTDARQRSCLPDEDGAVSYIVEPPLDGSGIAVWLHLVRGAADISRSKGMTVVSDGELRHIWNTGLTAAGADSELQTAEILRNYESILGSRGLSIEANCVRTWLYCHDIDRNYAGLVKARREYFQDHGLRADTHYIASTGICGTPVEEGRLVQLDAYAVEGPLEQRYLYARTHLNPTSEYGVTFERGVRVDYAGRAHCIISGTASIDNKGQIVHPGDVQAQTRRMWENVEALLAEGGARWSDIAQATVYLRNPSDYGLVADMFAEKLKGIPYVILHAPVCRPGWLVEMECMALI